MKKVLLVFIVIITGLCIYLGFDKINQYYATEIVTLPDQVAKSHQTMSCITVNFKDESKIDEGSEIILNYLDKTKTDCIVSLRLNDGLKKVKQFLIYSHDDVINKKYLDTKYTINFSKFIDKEYYTSDFKDKNSQGYLKSLNQTVFEKNNDIIEYTNFYQLADKIKNNDNMISLRVYDNNNFIADLQETLSKNKVLMNDYTDTYSGADLLAVNNYLIDQLLPLLLMAGVSFLAGVCFIVAKRENEILVLKSLGYSKVKIIYQCFGSFLINSIVIMLFTALMMFVVLAKEINLLTEEFLLFILVFSAIFIIFMFFVILVIWLYIKYVIRLDSLLYHENLKLIIIGNTIIKIAVTILIISPFINSFKETYPTLLSYLTVKTNEDIIGEYISFERYPERYNEIFNEFIDELTYVDFEYYYSNTEAMLREGFDDIVADIDEVVESSALDYPIIFANKQYLKDTDLYQQDGKALNLENIKEDVLLVPEEAKNIDLKNYNYENIKVIYVKNTDTFINYRCIEPYKLNNPIIRLVTKYSINTQFTNLYIKQKQINEIKQEIKDKYNVTNIQLRPNTLVLSFYYNRVENDLFKTIYILFMYLFVYLAMISNSIYSYVSDNKKLLAIQYMCGIPRKDRYKELILMNLVAYSLPIVVASLFLDLSLSSVILFCGFFAVLELLIEVIMLNIYERKGVVSSLKGGGF